ncbi:PREDICTED: subtilisin-like protease SBT4.5 [Tarenaya hassleriana]|uniref:subtilisin-like protease SBT4.5 n=1 Tax=Tarenaya hassleriana TaxID=28532 RepID=UPI00053C8AA2|nr:PREDICTED: subtilisin-like protease SBT4.5 [Tarenaya hassleriana]
MGAIPSNAEYMTTSQHINILQEVTGESSIENRLVRSYRRSFNGFAATLSDSERERVANMEGVVSVFPNRKLQLQTTASWDFMGFKENKTKRVPNLESDIIVGVIDSGIWPESASFDDNGFGPPPKKWKGECDGGKNFTCNNKIIGARYYNSSDVFAGTPESARDRIGHGSHTASTAAGNSVEDVSFYGLGLGTARGAVPAARIAAYKVCDPSCSSDQLLSAFDDAIADGVDVITISIGGPPTTFEQDPIAIGAFHAMAKGILTVNSAGNSGPSPGTVSSAAPWILSVAASNTNRAFLTKVVLGDGKTIVGRSVNPFDLNGVKYDLLYGKSASSTCDEEFAQHCLPGCLDEKLVKGKIVLCNSSSDILVAERAGAVGTIVKGTAKLDFSTVYSFPAAALSEDQYETAVSYVISTKDPKVSILKSDVSMKETAPVVVSFSSRGPNTLIPDILKPDVTAPGVEILAAYSLDVSPSGAERDTRRAKYSVVSGTSMSCPHVAGAAAYLKTFHPDWSPSMIKSAIMTTAWPMNATEGAAGSEFAYGSGHLNPIAATDPGLVYEATKADHIALLCALNLTTTSLRLISGDNSTCTKEQADTLPRNLNYPSMAAAISSQGAFNVTFVRTVTNVGMANSTYKAEVVKGAGSSKIDVKVEPDVLSMKSVYEKKSFTVTVSGEAPLASEPASATLVWSDGSHTVRSPIVIFAAPLF